MVFNLALWFPSPLTTGLLLLGPKMAEKVTLNDPKSIIAGNDCGQLNHDSNTQKCHNLSW